MQSSFLRVAVSAAVLLVAAPGWAQTAKSSGLQNLLDAELGRFAGAGGTYEAGIYVKQLSSGETAQVRGDVHFNSASVIKLAVLVLAFQQVDAHKWKLEDRYEWKMSDFRGGSGIFRYKDPGLKPTFRDVLTEMVITSDNSATDIMIAKVGGVEAVNAFLAKAGYSVLHLNHTLYEGFRGRYDRLDPKYKTLTPEQLYALQTDNPLFTTKYRALIDEVHAAEKAHPRENTPAGPPDEHSWLGIISPAEIGRLLEGIEQGTIASKESCDEMKRMLRAQQSGARKMPHFLNVPIGHKTGEVNGVTNDVGIIYAHSGPIVVSFLSQGYTGNTGEADDRLGNVTRLIVEYFDGTSQHRN